MWFGRNWFGRIGAEKIFLVWEPHRDGVIYARHENRDTHNRVLSLSAVQGSHDSCSRRRAVRSFTPSHNAEAVHFCTARITIYI